MEGLNLEEIGLSTDNSAWANASATSHAVRVTNGTTSGTFRFNMGSAALEPLQCFVKNLFGDGAADLPYVIGNLREGLRVIDDKDVIEAAAAKRTIHVGPRATCMPVYVETDDPEGPRGIVRVPYGMGCLDMLRRSLSDRLGCDAKEIHWNDQRITNDTDLIDAMTFFNAPVLGRGANPDMLKLAVSPEPEGERKSKRQRTQEPARKCTNCGATSPGSSAGARWTGMARNRILCTICYGQEYRKGTSK